MIGGNLLILRTEASLYYIVDGFERCLSFAVQLIELGLHGGGGRLES
jgi:hypothetical protein